MRNYLAALALLLTSVPYANSEPTSKPLKIMVDYQQVERGPFRPIILARPGVTAEISLTNEVRMKLTSNMNADVADLQFEIYSITNGVESYVGSPRILAKLDERGTMHITGQGSKDYSISVLVSESGK